MTRDQANNGTSLLWLGIVLLEIPSNVSMITCLCWQTIRITALADEGYFCRLSYTVSEHTVGYLSRSSSGVWRRFSIPRSKVLEVIILPDCSWVVSIQLFLIEKSKDKKAKPCHICSVLESGFLPGSLYTLSRWYSRGELAKRSVIFFYGNTLSAAFGSLLYAGCLRIDNHLGVKAWQW